MDKEQLTLSELYFYWKKREEDAYENYVEDSSQYYYDINRDNSKNVSRGELIEIVSTRKYYEDMMNKYNKDAEDELILLNKISK